jgi:hypothetical protein
VFGKVNERRAHSVAHEFNVALGGFAGDFEFFRQGFGVGVFAGFNFVL